MRNKSFPSLNFISYAVGAAAGLALTVAATWADLEANFYGFPQRANTPLTELSCPIFIGAGETSAISLRVTNTTNGLLSPAVRTEISTRTVFFTDLQSFRLEPGESKRLEWEIGPDNVDMKRFIFAQTLVYSAFPLPDREKACGVFVVNLPLKGWIITAGLTALGLLGMGLGLFWPSPSQGPARGVMGLRRPLMALAVVVLVGVLSAFLASWLLGIAALVVALLLIFVTLGFLEKE